MSRQLCSCGNLTERTGTNKHGDAIWGKTCRTCRGRQRYGILKADKCNKCGFLPITPNQLEIDHIDGDRQNNSPSNLETLCCNCHAYKTYTAKNIVFRAEENPFFGQRHSEETLSKIRQARKRQANRKKDAVSEK